jgi:hypothetical protein
MNSEQFINECAEMGREGEAAPYGLEPWGGFPQWCSWNNYHTAIPTLYEP